MVDRSLRSPEMRKQVALNEAAMAIVSVNFPDHRNIEFVTIALRSGNELGYVRMKMDYVSFKEGLLRYQLCSIFGNFICRQSLLDYNSVQLAPRAADELWYGKDQEIDSEALQILEICYKRTKGILEENQELMDAVVDNLLAKKSITKREFFNLHGSLKSQPYATFHT